MALSTNKLTYWFNGGNSHVAVSYNGSGQVSFYINGVLDSTEVTELYNILTNKQY